MIRDFGLEAHQAAEAHLEQCWAALADEEGPGDEEIPWPETAGPFCGCETCVIREALHAAWPIFVEAARAGLA